MATDQLIAEKAAKVVKINVEALSPTILTIEDAIQNSSYYVTPKAHHGNVEDAFTNSDHTLEGEMRIGGQEHFYMETQSCIAVPQEDEEMVIYISAQSPSTLQKEVAYTLGVPTNRVVVKTRRLGGAFGGKEYRSALVGRSTAIAAQKLVYSF